MLALKKAFSQTGGIRICCPEPSACFFPEIFGLKGTKIEACIGISWCVVEEVVNVEAVFFVNANATRVPGMDLGGHSIQLLRFSMRFRKFAKFMDEPGPQAFAVQ